MNFVNSLLVALNGVLMFGLVCCVVAIAVLGTWMQVNDGKEGKP